MPPHNHNWVPTHLKHLFPTHIDPHMVQMALFKLNSILSYHKHFFSTPIDPHGSQKIPYNLHLGTHKNPTFVSKNIKPL